jgi:hypothetical protein
MAEDANCSVRSVQESLKALVGRGVIDRLESFENGKQKASVYKIIGHRAPCYRGAKSAPPAKNEEIVASRDVNFAPTPKFCTSRGAENDVLSLREPNINNKKEKDYSPSEREASLPPDDRCVSDRYANDNLLAPDDVLEDIPAVMRETLDYFLLKTGRVRISSEELSALQALEEIHAPSRVNREIAGAAERFRKKGRLLSELTLVYIYRSLQYQNSLTLPRNEAPEDEFPDPFEGGCL